MLIWSISKQNRLGDLQIEIKKARSVTQQGNKGTVISGILPLVRFQKDRLSSV